MQLFSVLTRMGTKNYWLVRQEFLGHDVNHDYARLSTTTSRHAGLDENLTDDVAISQGDRNNVTRCPSEEN